MNVRVGLVTLDKRMEWDPMFRKHVENLDKEKPVIICGDMNVAHQEIDLKNPKTNKKNAGFTQEERDGFTELLSAGFVDSYRLDLSFIFIYCYVSIMLVNSIWLKTF